MTAEEDLVRTIMVQALELPVRPEEIDVNAPLFGPQTAGGLGLDSLSSLEILAALSNHFELPFEDVEASDFQTVSTLASYLRRQGKRVSQ